MRKLGILLLFSLVFGNIVLALEFEQPGSYVPGELMVKLSKNANPELLINDYRFADLTFERNLSSRLNIWLVKFNQKNTDEYSLLKQLKNDNRVALAQFNHYLEERETPDDTMYPLQWNMHNTGQTNGLEDADIDAPEAWDLNVGGVCANGDTVVIAIVDSGCDILHDDLNFWKNEAEIPGNGIDDDGNGYIDDYDGWNAVSHSGIISTSSHGTHVAGIAAAIGNNNLGVSGVNWNAKVMPIKGSTSVEAIAVEAYSYVHEMRSIWDETDGAEGAFVVSTNSSFGVNYGNPDNYPIWVSMYNEMGEIGILSATATMNIGADVDAVGDMPTSCDSEYMISVTNTTDSDVRNSGAAYGLTTIDLGAPGTNIRSTNYNNGYSNKTGTSMSTPHVAGAIAYLISAAPLSFLNNYLENPAEGAQLIRDYILQGVDPLTDLEGETVTGGRLNIYNSLMLFEPAGESGTIAEDRTWGDTIEVVGDITISDGVTLTINPGTTVTFAENFNITVLGTILAQGTPEEIIEFVPADTLVGWGGIVFMDTNASNDSSFFSYSRFYKANCDQEPGSALQIIIYNKVNIDNCSFEKNRTIGGGAALNLNHASIEISNSSFSDNLSWSEDTNNGGAIFVADSNAKISNCSFSNNLAGFMGGAAYFTLCDSVVIENSSFHNNIANYSGGAIYAMDNGIEIKSSTFNGNITSQNEPQNSGGAISLEGCEVKLVNNLITNNSSSKASALAAIHSYGLITNNTFSGNNCPVGENNSALQITNAMDIGNLFILNNIIWDNGVSSDYQIGLVGDYADPDIEYNNIQGGFASIWVEEGFEFEGIYENNIDEDPQFIEDNPYNYALTQYSPSVNAGMADMSAYEIPELDLAGNSRIFEGIVTRIDQGCYEYQGDNVSSEDTDLPIINGISSIYPNPFNPTGAGRGASTTINFNLKKNMLVKIEIFNLKGQKINTVLNSVMNSGNHSVNWNGFDSNQKPVSSGIYFSRMETSEKISIKKMMLLK